MRSSYTLLLVVLATKGKKKIKSSFGKYMLYITKLSSFLSERVSKDDLWSI